MTPYVALRHRVLFEVWTRELHAIDLELCLCEGCGEGKRLHLPPSLRHALAMQATLRRAVAGLLACGLLACGGATRGDADTGERPGAGGAGAGAGGSAPDGGHVELEEIPRSGSRIRVEGQSSGGVWLGTTGATDMRTGVPCEPVKAEDGETRCLPSGTLGQVAFVDAACTEPLFVVPSSFCDGPPPEHAVYREASTCPVTGWRVVSRGASREVPAMLHGLVEATCIEVVPASSAVAFEAVPSPPGDWMAFERRLVPLAPDLGVEVWEGEDGSGLWGGFRILPDDLACRPESEDGAGGFAAGPHVCVPSVLTRLEGQIFADGACTEPAVQVAECVTGAVIVEGEGGGAAGARYFALGAPLRDDELRWTLNGACERATPSWLVGLDHFRKGSALPLSGFPALNRVEAGEGRLRSLFWTVGDTVVQTDVGALRDRESGEQCSPSLLTDGTLRCLSVPSTLELTGALFSEPTCTERVAELPFECAPAGTPGPSVIARYVPPEGGACGDVVAILYDVAGRHEGPVYTDLGGCRPAGTAGCNHYRLGPEAEPATFPEVVLGER